jgi:hypothetical protein
MTLHVNTTIVPIYDESGESSDEMIVTPTSSTDTASDEGLSFNTPFDGKLEDATAKEQANIAAFTFAFPSAAATFEGSDEDDELEQARKASLEDWANLQIALQESKADAKIPEYAAIDLEASRIQLAYLESATSPKKYHRKEDDELCYPPSDNEEIEEDEDEEFTDHKESSKDLNNKN